MIKTTARNNTLDPFTTPVENASRQYHKQRAITLLSTPEATNCLRQIKQVVREIQPAGVRKVISHVFDELFSLLGRLRLVETFLNQTDLAGDSLALQEIIHERAYKLSRFIQEEGLTCSAMTKEVFDTLDEIAFAINHDLRQAFEFQQQTASEKPASDIGQMIRAHDLLSNCVRHSIVTLASAFNIELIETRLFSSSERRRWQSLQLCEDILQLLRLVQACEGGCNEFSLLTLSAGIEKFRNESLESLMHSDWVQFEGFCERMSLAGSSSNPERRLLHELSCYLETLLGQVKKRSVLSNVSAVQFGVDALRDTMNNSLSVQSFL